MALEKRQLVMLLQLALLVAGSAAIKTSVHAQTADAFVNLRQVQNQYQLTPQDRTVQRRYVLALKEARLPAAALDLANQHPGIVSIEERQTLQADQVAEIVRLANSPSRTQEERFALADRALVQYDALLRQWQAQSLEGTDAWTRIRIDQVQALHARQRMQEVINAYEALRRDQIAVPDYILNEVAAAWLYLKQPEKAAQLYRTVLSSERVDDLEINDDRLAFYYALRESGQHDEATKNLNAWVNQQPTWRPVKGNPQPLPSEAWFNLTRLSAQDPIYENRPAESIEKLQTLSDAAPRDAGLRIALGDAQRLQGLNRTAEVTLKQAETLEPHHPELISAQGMNALALQEWDQARELTTYATSRYPEHQSTQRIKDEWDAHNQPRLQIKTSGAKATDSPVAGSRDLITEALIYSSPIASHWRLYGGVGYGNADFAEGRLNHHWFRAGAQWRTRDITLEGDVSRQFFNENAKTGLRLAGQIHLSDEWQAGAQLAWNTPETPLRALKNDITARRMEVWLKYGSTPDAQWMLALAPSRFSDGNQRLKARLQGRQRLYAASEIKVHLELDVSASRNTREDAPYFNPRQDLEVLPGLVLTHTLYQRYDTKLEHGVKLRAGTYSQKGYGTGSVAALGYRVRYQNGFGNDSSIEQTDNTNASATITTYGSFNDNVVMQEDTTSTTASISTNWGNNNNNYISQEDVTGSSASVYQAASFGTVVIEQSGGQGGHHGWHGGHGSGDGTNQVAVVNQLSGWGHDAYIGQTGHNVTGTINQSGHRNSANIDQKGTSGDPDNAIVTQSGSHNEASVTQHGKDLNASVLQLGSFNVANVSQHNRG